MGQGERESGEYNGQSILNSRYLHDPDEPGESQQGRREESGVQSGQE